MVSMFHRIIRTENDVVLAILRLVLGVVVFSHGAQKMLGLFGGRGFGGTIAFYQHLGFAPVLGFFAVAIEFFGGLALIAGFLGRVAALAIIARLVVVVATLYWQFGFFMNWNGDPRGEGYEFHLLAFALAVAILVRGSGAFSVDRLLSQARSLQAG
jgi:putative oxidoreductase